MAILPNTKKHCPIFTIKSHTDYFKHWAIFWRSLLIMWLRCFHCLWNFLSHGLFFLAQTSRYTIHKTICVYFLLVFFVIIRFSIKSNSFLFTINIINSLWGVFVWGVFLFLFSQFTLILVTLSVIFFTKILSINFSVLTPY
jgi:hypothetical protein